MDMILDREAARSRAVELKGGGLTLREVVVRLCDECYENELTGRSYGSWTVREWCVGVCDLRGHRHPHLLGMGEEERRLHGIEMRERKLRRVREWRLRNLDRVREYERWYRVTYGRR